MATPVEPPPTAWSFPDPRTVAGDLVGMGADLEPGTLVAAYRAGLFPMPVGPGAMAWWSPDPRAVMPLHGLRVTRSLRRSLRRFEVRVDTAAEEVLDGCGHPDRDGGWITPEVRHAYLRLHAMGWVHTVEAWTPGGELAGGLYGVGVGGLFAGESMFHRLPDASKVALAGLVEILAADGLGRLLDVQWRTPHLASLGAVEVPRAEYLRRLEAVVEMPPPAAFAGTGSSPTVASGGQEPNLAPKARGGRADDPTMTHTRWTDG